MGIRIYTYKWPSYLSAFLVGLMIFYLGITYHVGLRDNQADQVISWVTINRRIVIDPGHGGVDPGAKGSGGTLEKDVALEVALSLAAFLHQAGADIVLTREDDRDLSTSLQGYSKKKREDLKARVELINGAGADLLVSIHANSFPSDKWSGAQTFYDRNSEAGKELALHIQQSLNEITGNSTRKENAIDAYLLDKASPPGVIVEVGFLSNPQEEKLLQDSAYQEKLAWAILHGIARYLAGPITK